MTTAALLPDLVAKADLVTPMALRVAATLRVADHVRAGATGAAAVAARAGADPDVVDALARHLVTVGVLAVDGDRLAVTELGSLLYADAPGRLRDVLDIDGGVGRAELALVELLATARTGRPAYEVRYGRGYWADVDADPALAASVEALRPTQPGFDAGLVIDGVDWSRAASVVDVGGSNGALLAALLRAHPHLNGTLVDLPRFAEAAGKVFAAAGVADRAEAVGGSFFAPLPPGADVYLLSGILYDWDDDTAVGILRRCADAAGPGGTIVLSEISLDGWGSAPDGAMSLRMMATVRGRERSVEALVALARRAGLELVRAAEPTPSRCLLELRVGD